MMCGVSVISEHFNLFCSDMSIDVIFGLSLASGPGFESRKKFMNFCSNLCWLIDSGSSHDLHNSFLYISLVTECL